MTKEHATDFASELVRMAQAMTRLPEVEADLADITKYNDELHGTIQRLELKLIDRNADITTLRTKVRELEVSRDDAELRFLEADDAKDTLVRILDNLGKDILGALQAVAPVPMPKAEAEAVAETNVPTVTSGTGSVPLDPTASTTVTTTPSASCDGANAIAAAAIQGQALCGESAPLPIYGNAATLNETGVSSELSSAPTGESAVDPTVNSTIGDSRSETAPIQSVENRDTVDGSTTPQADPVYPRPFGLPTTAEPSPPDASSSADIVGDGETIHKPHGPYVGKKYWQIPGHVSHSDWLAGGGTEHDYWHTDLPQASSASHHS
jgi:hypothetical protein